MKQPEISYATLAKSFVKIGANSFGGWSTTALLLEKEFITRQHALTPKQTKGATAYAQILPGATQVSLVASIGYQLRGFKGATVATLSYLMPAVLLVTLFAALYFQSLHNSPHLTENLDGLVAALAGVIVANAYKIGSKHTSYSALWLVVLAAFVAVAFAHINALLVLMVCGVAGLTISYLKAKR